MPNASPERSKPRQRRSAPTPAQALASARAITKGRKIGRPRTYTPAMCDEAIALGYKGKNWPAIARQFGVDRATLNKWAAEFPDFSNALDRARAAAQAWWEEKVQSKLGAKHFQANAARLVMTAQFDDYREAAKGGSNPNGLDLLGLVNAIAQGATAGALQASASKDDAATAALDVVPEVVHVGKARE